MLRMILPITKRLTMAAIIEGGSVCVPAHQYDLIPFRFEYCLFHMHLRCTFSMKNEALICLCYSSFCLVLIRLHVRV